MRGDMKRSHALHRLRTEDDGLGIVTAIFVMAVVSALAFTATGLTVNNLENTRRDRQGLAALATSEAGVARAVAHLRTGSLGSLTCYESDIPNTCQGATESWISQKNPKQVRLDGTAGGCTSTIDCFRVWIAVLRPYVPNCAGRTATPPTPCTGTYRIHSTGVSGQGPGARQLAVDVDVAPYPFPIGVFAETFAGSGQMGIHRQSLFTTGCVQNRVRDDGNASGVRFEYDTAAGRTKLDLVYNIPAAAHAQGDISTSNNSCGTGSGGGPIHNTTTPVRCNPQFRFDQSGSGGPLTSGDGCRHAYGSYPETSLGKDLEVRYGYRPRGLTDGQYATLKSQAMAQQTYNIAPGSIKARLQQLAVEGVTSPVLYFDSGSVSLKQADFPDDFSRALSDAASCGSKSVTIVVVGSGNNLSYQGGASAPYLVASIFVPDGQLTGTGGRKTIGTIFAKSIDMSGGNDFYMDACFTNNPPGAIVDVEVVNWAEDDARDFN